MSYKMHLPPGTKVSERRVLLGFMANIRAGVDAGDPGSIAAYLRSKVRLAEISMEQRQAAMQLRDRRLP